MSSDISAKSLRASTKLRLVLTAHQYWPEPGPASLRLRALVGELRSRGHRVTVWTTGTEDNAQGTRVGPDGEEIKVIFRAAVKSGTSFRRVGSLVGFARAISREVRMLSTNEDVIVLSDPPPTAAFASARASRKMGWPFAYYLCDSWALAAQSGSARLRAFGRLFRTLEAYALRKSDLTIAVTEGLRKYATKQGAGNVLTIANGVDFSQFAPSDGETISVDGISSDTPLLTYAGTAGVVHGATIFADAAEKMWNNGEDFQILFVGAGRDMKSLAERAQASGGRMIVHPPVAAAQVGVLLRRSTASLVSLAPGSGYEDARPTKALASLAVGTPIVYVGSGAFRDELRTADVAYLGGWDVDEAVEAMRAALRSGPPTMERRDQIMSHARSRYDLRAGVAHIAAELENIRLGAPS